MCGKFSGLLLLGALGITACQDSVAPPEQPAAPPMEAKSSTSLEAINPALQAQIDKLNARLEKGGSKIRLTGGWFFTLGKGVPQFRLLRSGARWTHNDLHYIFDAGDLGSEDGLSLADVENAISAGYNAWSNVSNTSIRATEIPDFTQTGFYADNADFLDGTYDNDGNCVSFIDVSSPTLVSISDDGLEIEPPTDIFVGGFLPEKYFSQCLGSEDIIAVTWTLSGGDVNHDNYEDLVYVEQFMNTRFRWVTSGAEFLDDDFFRVDIQSIMTHEDGHSLGLGHYGGPNDNQPLSLHQHDRIFTPEAVMNPFYVGGEKRDLFNLDQAALRTLYTGH
ncbi:MAG TPA: hypothetical protein VFH40_10920 [Gemmatimonadales bacterium]|nr:hypothetical protein [Gemmatimonadales bacterium]